MDNNKGTNRRSGANKWLVFVSSFFVLVTMAGFFFSLGKMFVIIMETFHTTRAEAATIQSVAMGVDHSLGIVSGAINHKYGSRMTGLLGSIVAVLGLTSSFFATSYVYLVVSIGFFMGFGKSLLFISATTAVGQHFRGKYSTIALSVLSTGAGLGGMIYPYLIDFLNDMYGIRGALLIIGAIVFNAMAAAFLREKPPLKLKEITDSNRVNDINGNINQGFTKSDKEDSDLQKKAIEEKMSNQIETINNINIIMERRNSRVNDTQIIYSLSFAKELPVSIAKPQSSIKQSLKHLMKNKPFVVFVLAQSLVNPAVSIFLSFIVDIFQDKHFSNSSASLALLLLNLCNALGRLSPGVLTLLPGVTTLSVPVIATVIGTLSLIAIVFTKTLTIVLIICVANGLGLGMVRSAFTVITAKLVGREHMSIGIGCAFILNGIVSMIIGPLCGYIRDRTGSYTFVFVGASTAATIGCLLFVIAQCLKTKVTTQRKRSGSVFYATNM